MVNHHEQLPGVFVHFVFLCILLHWQLQACAAGSGRFPLLPHSRRIVWKRSWRSYIAPINDRKSTWSILIEASLFFITTTRTSSSKPRGSTIMQNELAQSETACRENDASDKSEDKSSMAMLGRSLSLPKHGCTVSVQQCSPCAARFSPQKTRKEINKRRQGRKTTGAGQEAPAKPSICSEWAEHIR